jgi:hypothetical protein
MFASRSGTSRQAAKTARGSNGGDAARFGPIPARPIIAAAASAAHDATATGIRQSNPPKALKRCGVAEPSVSAPTRMPTISPMSPFAHVEASFMPTG